MSKMVVGYTTGVYDLFHIGHLNMLRNAKSLCDKLIVGVSVDELPLKYKNKRVMVPYEERVEIVRAIRYVDTVIPQYDFDKFKAWERLHFDILFHGDDWYDNPLYREMHKKLEDVGVRMVYFPYTKGTSSTILNDSLKKLREEC